jgi:hypothetical protein
LSPDLQSAWTRSPSQPSNVSTIVPVGPGEARKVVIPLQQLTTSRWFPDGKRLAVVGSERGRPLRSYEYTIASGKLRPLTPEGTTGTLVSPDNRLLIAATGAKWMVWPVDGGERRDVKGLLAQDAISAWAADGRSLFVSAPTTTSGRDIARLDLATGRRERLVTFGPSNAAGVLVVGTPFVSADGRTYAYHSGQLFSDLFVGDGIR